MLQLYENIKKRRRELNMTQSDLAEKLGYADKSMIAKIEKGTVDLPQSKIIAFASVLGISAGDLTGWDSKIAPDFDGPKEKRKGIPIHVLAHVAAGTPIESTEDIVDTEEITEELAATGHFFGLQIDGDSMEPKISKGDIVIVRQQDDAENGEIVIATVDGCDATCKRLRKYRDGIELISTNPTYAPEFYSKEDMERKPVKIIGRVVELRAKF